MSLTEEREGEGEEEEDDDEPEFFTVLYFWQVRTCSCLCRLFCVCVSDGDLCTASAPKTSLLLATVQSICIRLKGAASSCVGVGVLWVCGCCVCVLWVC